MNGIMGISAALAFAVGCTGMVCAENAPAAKANEAYWHRNTQTGYYDALTQLANGTLHITSYGPDGAKETDYKDKAAAKKVEKECYGLGSWRRIWAKVSDTSVCTLLCGDNLVLVDSESDSYAVISGGKQHAATHTELADLFPLKEGEGFSWRFNEDTQRWDKVIMRDSHLFVYQWNERDAKWNRLIIRTAENSEGALGNLKQFDKRLQYTRTDGAHSSDGLLWLYDNRRTDAPQRKEDFFKRMLTLTEANFDPSKKTYLIIHGLNNSFLDDWVSGIAAKLAAAAPDTQILVLDWGYSAENKLLGQPDLFGTSIPRVAAKASILLGQLAGTLGDSVQLKPLMSKDSKDLVPLNGLETRLTLIGHSYGAHVASYLCKNVAGKPDKLVGLDSAVSSPQCFHKVILGPDSASHVEFYKSSNILSGGTAYGGMNFMVAGQDGALSRYCWIAGDEKQNHSYSCQMYTDMLDGMRAGGGPRPLSEEDYEKLYSWTSSGNSHWSGIIRKDGRIVCLTQGYEKAANGAGGWNVDGYCEVMDSVIASGTFQNHKAEMAKGWFKWKSQTERMLRNKGDGFSNPMDFFSSFDWSKCFEVFRSADNLSAAAYLCDMQLGEGELNGEPVGALTGASDTRVLVKAGQEIGFSFAVKNAADNTVFEKEFLNEAWQRKHQGWEIFVSTSPKETEESLRKVSECANGAGSSAPANCIRVACGKAPGNVLPQTTVRESASFTLTRDQVDKLVENSGSPFAKAVCKRMGMANLYVYIRCGVCLQDAAAPGHKHAGCYVLGELDPSDNLSKPRKITVLMDRAPGS